jgi:hypothetical protein
MNTVVLTIAKPGRRPAKEGVIARVPPGSRIALDPQAQGVIIQLPNGSIRMIDWCGESQELKTAEDGTILHPVAEVEDLYSPPQLPHPLPKGIIEITEEEEPTTVLEAPPGSARMRPDQAQSPEAEPQLLHERIASSEFSWWDVALLDGEVVSIVESKCIYSISAEAIPAETTQPNSKIKAIISAVKKKLGFAQ